MFGIGSIIDGRYEIISHVGDGGMGSVYKANQIDVGRIVALKVLHSSLSEDSENKARFLREAKALYDIVHPNLPVFYHIGNFNQALYMVMEFVEGESLRAVIDREKKLPAARVLQIASQVCAAVEAAHAIGVVHRDIKPSNIMLLPSPQPDFVKVVDFGLARLLPKAHEPDQQKLTQTGLLIGSIHYMSPEQCLGRQADHRSDIYALGCVLYEALTGEPPLEADNPIGLLHKHVKEAPDFSKIEKLGAPPGTVAVLNKALTKSVEDRYQTISNLKQDIELLLQGRSSEICAAIAPNQKRNAAMPLLIGTAILLAGTGWAALFLNKQSQAVPIAATKSKIKKSTTLLAGEALGFAKVNRKLAMKEAIAVLKRPDLKEKVEKPDLRGLIELAIDEAMGRRDFQQAEQYANQFAQIYHDSNEDRAYQHTLQSRVHRYKNEIKAAVKHYEQALSILAMTPGRYFGLESDTKIALAETLDEDHQYERAEKTLREFLKEPRPSDYDQLRARAMLLLARYAAWAGKLEEARELNSRAQVFLHERRPKLATHLYQYLPKFLENGHAQTYIDIVSSDLSENDPVDEQLVSCESLALACLHTSDYKSARTYFEKHWKLLDKVNAVTTDPVDKQEYLRKRMGTISTIATLEARQFNNPRKARRLFELLKGEAIVSPARLASVESQILWLEGKQEQSLKLAEDVLKEQEKDLQAELQYARTADPKKMSAAERLDWLRRTDNIKDTINLVAFIADVSPPERKRRYQQLLEIKTALHGPANSQTIAVQKLYETAK